MLRSILAPNPSPMTLTGTRTYIVGERRVVVIDPGSDAVSHLDAIGEAVGDARVEAIALTHLHPDHVPGADELADRFGTEIRAMGLGTLEDGHRMTTDAGALEAVHTPGHTPDHVALHWNEGEAVFCGDLMMGGLETALVAPPEGNLRQYLSSLEVLRAMRPRIVHPSHGPSFDDPSRAIAAYIRHRRERVAQVRAVIDAGVMAEAAIVERVYGDTIAAELRGAAAAAVVAYLEYLEEEGEIRRVGSGWTLSAPPTPP